MSDERVPKGYKNTEIGVIPEDWEYNLLLGKIELISGRHIVSNKYNYEEIGTPYLTGPADFKNDIPVISKWTKENGAEAINGDVLITVKGSGAGSSFKLSLPKAIISRQLMALRSKFICLEYLFYVIKKKEIHFASKAIGNLIPGLSRTDILSLNILLPPLPEQQAIATTLSNIDNLITALDKLIAKKRDIKTATIQQLLTGKKRLPGFGEEKGYQNTEIGVIPEDWEVRELESLGTGTVPPVKAGPFGSALTKDTYVPSGYKVYGQEQVIRGDHLYGDYFISIDKFKQLESCAVRPGDILLSLVGTMGKVLVVPKDAPQGIINPRLIRLSFDKELVKPRFFKLLFESGEIQRFLFRYAQGGTMGVLNAGTLKAVNVGLPSIEEQKAIATILSNQDDEITALEKRLAKTKAIKQGMMQELLTGKTRLMDNG